MKFNSTQSFFFLIVRKQHKYYNMYEYTSNHEAMIFYCWENCTIVIEIGNYCNSIYE